MAIKKTRYEKVNTADVAVTVISSILITTVATTIIMGLGPTPAPPPPPKKKKKNQLAQFSRRHKNRKQKGAPASEKVCVFFFLENIATHVQNYLICIMNEDDKHRLGKRVSAKIHFKLKWN